MNNRLLFCFPGAYTLLKRMVTYNKRLGLFCYHVIPMVYLYFSSHEFRFSSLFTCLLLVIAFYAQYEIGYIYNDTETIKLEDKPSKRLSEDEIAYYSKRKMQIYSFHIAFFVFFGLIAMLLEDNLYFSFYTLGLMAIEAIIFLCYNRVRGKTSLLIFFFLELLKYLPFVAIYESPDWQELLVLVACIYALPNTIERLSFKRYGIHFIQVILPTTNSYLKFRVLFYVGVCLLLMMDANMKDFLPLFVFLLIFRISALVKIKKL